MSRFSISKLILAVFAAALACSSQSALACAMCYGNKTDSPLAAGMNWGIFSLLGVVVFVLGCLGSFFIFLARRASAAPAIPPQREMLELTQKA